MTDTNPTFLDLDALLPPKQVVVKLKGKEHQLAEITVESFVANIELIQKLGASGNIQTEMELMQTVLLRAFPTMEKSDLGGLRLDQLQTLADFAMKHSGQKTAEDQVVDEAKAKGEANPQ